MHDPLAHQDDGARGKHIVIHAILGQRAPPDDPRGRIEAHRLGEHGSRVGQACDVAGAKRAIAERVDFGVETLLRVIV